MCKGPGADGSVGLRNAKWFREIQAQRVGQRCDIIMAMLRAACQVQGTRPSFHSSGRKVLYSSPLQR